MRKAAAILFILFCAFALNAQQIGVFSHFFYKPMVYNPAFTGAGDEANAMLISHSQWTGFKGAPQLTLFTLDGNFMEKKAGVGLQLISDRKGITNRVGGNLSYSYKLKLNDETHLAFGLSLGIIDQTYDFSKSIVETGSDPVLFPDSQHKTAFDGSFGLALNWKDLEFGFAVPQILGNKIKFADNTSNVRDYYIQERNYMTSVKYKFLISKEKGISISPLALVRILPNTPLQYDGTVTMDWYDKFWIGASYKSAYAVAANAGFCVYKQLYVGYSYDFITGSIGKYSGISHEIMVNFKLGKNRRPAPVPDVIPEKQKPVVDNKVYEDKMNELQEQLKKNEDKLKELSDKLEEQSKNQIKTAAAAAATGQNPREGLEEKDGAFNSKRNDFKTDKNVSAETGYYVIVGIFFYRDFANAEVKNFNGKGFKETSFLYSESKQNNYVFVQKLNTKEEAAAKLKEVITTVPDAWVLYLTD